MGILRQILSERNARGEIERVHHPKPKGIASRKSKPSRFNTRSLSYTYEMRDKRLMTFGYKSYKEYLESDTWKKIKCWYWKKLKPTECYCCGNKNLPLQLHHLSYKNLDQKEIHKQARNLLPVCNSCHNLIHEEHKKGKKTLRNTTRSVRRKIRSKQCKNSQQSLAA